jgi:DeoR/GlpR family transcriptional regulator of sugar metabolism
VLATQRQMRIVDEVRRRGSVRVSTLSDIFAVSDMTIRRDLDVLAAQGLVEKVHGGATSLSSSSANEPGFEAKRLQNQVEKAAIAAAAADLVEPGMAVGLSAGTTTWTLAKDLCEVNDLTVVTNSMQVAQVFQTTPARSRTVILTGGVRTPSDALVGPFAVAALRQLHLDVLFLGVHGMSERAGYSTPNLLEADVNRAFVDAAHRLVVVADRTKWGQVGLATIAPLDRADLVITDQGLEPRARERLIEIVGEVRLVETTESAAS